MAPSYKSLLTKLTDVNWRYGYNGTAFFIHCGFKCFMSVPLLNYSYKSGTWDVRQGGLEREIDIHYTSGIQPGVRKDMVGVRKI